MKRSAARTRVRAMVNEPVAKTRFFQNSAIDTWIDEGIKDICIKTLCLTKICTAITTSPDTTSYAYPTICNATAIITIGIKTVLSSSNESMNYVPLDLMGRVGFDTSLTTWSIWDEKIILNPQLATAGSMTPLVWTMEGCTVDNTEFPIPAEYHNAVPLYAAYKAYQKRKIFEASKKMRVEYMNEINRLKSTVSLRSMMTSSKTTIANQVPMFTGLEEGAGLYDLVINAYSVFHSAAIAVTVTHNDSAVGASPQALSAVSPSETISIPVTAVVSGGTYWFQRWGDTIALSTSRTFQTGGGHTALYTSFGVQTLHIKLEDDEDTANASIPHNVDMSRTICMKTGHTNKQTGGDGVGWHHQCQSRIWLKDSATVAVERQAEWQFAYAVNTAAMEMKVEVQLIEMPAFMIKSIQRGYFALTETVKSAQITINTVDTATTMILENGWDFDFSCNGTKVQADGRDYSSGHTIIVKINDATTISCARPHVVQSCTISTRVSYEVVEFYDSVINSLTHYNVRMCSESTVNTIITEVNTASTVIIPRGHHGNSDDHREHCCAWWLTSSTNLASYSRALLGNRVSGGCTVIDFNSAYITNREQRWDAIEVGHGDSAGSVALAQTVAFTRTAFFPHGEAHYLNDFHKFHRRIWLNSSGETVEIEYGANVDQAGSSQYTNPFTVLEFI